MNGTLVQWLSKRLDLDAAVFFGVLNPTWQVIAGPVSILLIAQFLPPEAQGFYYTFSALLAAQVFVELGFYLVILNAASHEWTHLTIDSSGRMVGDLAAISRLVSLGRLISRWYAVASIVFVIGMGTAGYIFFSRDAAYSVNWQFPWFALVILNGLLLWTLPFGSLLEGCNQVRTINQIRLVQTVVSTMAFWVVLTVGGGLWAAVAMAATRFACDLYLLTIRYRRFFEPFFHPPSGPLMSWKEEIWPMQWRLAVSGITVFFAFSLFTPVMFRYYGAVVAGQMGMTLQIVRVLQAFALPWIYTKAPRFGTLISRKRYGELDQLWKRALTISVSLIALGAGSVWVIVYLATSLGLPISERFLAPLPTGLFLFAAVVMQVSQCESVYLRAHRQEPMLVVNVVTSLGIGLTVWLLGRRFGPIGAAAAYLGVVIPAVIWQTAIWVRFKRRWHHESAS